MRHISAVAAGWSAPVEWAHASCHVAREIARRVATERIDTGKPARGMEIACPLAIPIAAGTAVGPRGRVIGRPVERRDRHGTALAAPVRFGSAVIGARAPSAPTATAPTNPEGPAAR
jgi:hypothetical protein